MKLSVYVIFMLSSILFFGCTPKNGVDETVFISDQNKASDEVYVNFLTEQIDNYPSGEDKYIKLAEIYRRKHKLDEAVELLKKGELENSGNINLLIELASLYLENGNIHDLSKTLNDIRKIDPDNVYFLKLSAGYSLLLKDYTNAIFFANRAMLANPFDDEIFYLRGSAFLINLDSISALNSFEEAYNLMESYKNFSKIFNLSIALRNDILAKKYLNQFDSKTTSPQLCYEKGVYLHEIGERDTAKIVLKECFAKNGKDPRVYLELSKIYYEENAIDSARYAVNQFLDLKPDDVVGYVLKARIMEKLNNFSDAKELYLSALEIDSTYTLASSGLENLERKVAYLQLIKRKENVQRQVEFLKPLNSKVIN